MKQCVWAKVKHFGLLMDEFENDSSDLEADEENDDIDEENGIDEESVIDKENDIDEELEDKEYMTVGEGSYTDEMVIPVPCASV